MFFGSTSSRSLSSSLSRRQRLHSAIEQAKDELADEAWPVAATDQLRLADELVDAARSKGLIAVRMIRISMRIVGLDIADRSAVELDQKALDFGFIDMALDVPKS